MRPFLCDSIQINFSIYMGKQLRAATSYLKKMAIYNDKWSLRWTLAWIRWIRTTESFIRLTSPARKRILRGHLSTSIQIEGKGAQNGPNHQLLGVPFDFFTVKTFSLFSWRNNKKCIRNFPVNSGASFIISRHSIFYLLYFLFHCPGGKP